MARTTDIDKHIASRLKELRAQNSGANMAKLARFLGITYQSYQGLESGLVSFRYSTLVKLAAFYGMAVEQLVGDDPLSKIPNISRISYVVDMMTKMPEADAIELMSMATEKVKARNGVGR